MYEAAQHVVTPDLKCRDRRAGRAGGHAETDAPVGSLLVVMADKLAYDPLEMTRPEDEHVVEALGTHRPHPALVIRVGPR